jgi:hypothetical protein
MNKSQVEILSKINIKSDIKTSGFIWLNDDIKYKIIQNVTMTEISNLYPKILVDLFKNGLIPQSEFDNISKVNFILNNKELLKKTEDWQNLKFFVNSYYGKLSDPFNNINEKYEGIISTKRLQKYIEMEYTNLLSLNNNILYIDTDIIFSQGDIITNNIFDIQPIKENANIFLIESIKKYFYHDGDNYVIRGKIDINKYKPEIQSIFRDQKLNKLGV